MDAGSPVAHDRDGMSRSTIKCAYGLDKFHWGLKGRFVRVRGLSCSGTAHCNFLHRVAPRIAELNSRPSYYGFMELAEVGWLSIPPTLGQYRAGIQTGFAADLPHVRLQPFPQWGKLPWP
jgi:hypothetical protein